jgi:imidazolonepropionase-like amidohydrolase
LHEELIRLVEAGLTPLAALQAATLNPARVPGLALDRLLAEVEALHHKGVKREKN